MNNLIQEGDAIDITAPYAVSAGGACLVGTALFGVAVDTYSSGSAGVIRTKGVFDLTKTTGPSFAIGARVYWDNTNKYVTTSSTDAPLEVGIATTTAGTGATTARVKLHEKI